MLTGAAAMPSQFKEGKPKYIPMKLNGQELEEQLNNNIIKALALSVSSEKDFRNFTSREMMREIESQLRETRVTFGKENKCKVLSWTFDDKLEIRHLLKMHRQPKLNYKDTFKYVFDMTSRTVMTYGWNFNVENNRKTIINDAPPQYKLERLNDVFDSDEHKKMMDNFIEYARTGVPHWSTIS